MSAVAAVGGMVDSESGESESDSEARGGPPRWPPAREPAGGTEPERAGAVGNLPTCLAN